MAYAQPQVPELPQAVQTTLSEREPYEHERDLHAEHAVYDRTDLNMRSEMSPFSVILHREGNAKPSQQWARALRSLPGKLIVGVACRLARGATLELHEDPNSAGADKTPPREFVVLAW